MSPIQRVIGALQNRPEGEVKAESATPAEGNASAEKAPEA